MYQIGLYLLIYGCLTWLLAVLSHTRRLAKWNSFRMAKGGKRHTSISDKTDWVQSLGRQFMPVLSVEHRQKLRNLLIWSGMDAGGRVEQFLGLCAMFLACGCGMLLLTVLAAAAYDTLLPLLGVPVALLVIACPGLSIIMSRAKRADGILREFPDLVLAIRRELSRSANYIEAFIHAQADLQGVLHMELSKLNQYVRSTQGDIRTALAHFKERCGHRTIDLFCMTIVQGMDTDRVVEGLTELEQQMINLLKDRMQKQTEKRNLMVFFGTIVAASILMLQGAFYGLLKLKEQMGSLPF